MNDMRRWLIAAPAGAIVAASLGVLRLTKEDMIRWGIAGFVGSIMGCAIGLMSWRLMLTMMAVIVGDYIINRLLEGSANG